MNRSSKITALLFFLVTTLVSAQEKWTLDQCITFALDHNLQLNDFEYTEQSGRETYKQSIRDLLPNVSGQTSYTVNFGRSTDPFTNDVVTTDFFKIHFLCNLP